MWIVPSQVSRNSNDLEVPILYDIKDNPIGIYEKALPSSLSWDDRLSAARDAGFRFLEMSVDETDARIARLQWSKAEKGELLRSMFRQDMPILSMCLSGNRRYPIGSESRDTRLAGVKLIKDAIDFALDLGIRIIQLAGYDEYANPSTDATTDSFLISLEECVRYAEKRAVMLAMETMENELMTSVQKAKRYVDALRSPWFKIYPDVGNLTASGQNVESDFRTGRDDVVAIHVKDTLTGVFRDIPFGEGNVDFVSFFRFLIRERYSGIFVVEMWADQTKDSIQQIKRAREFLADKMKQAADSP